MQTEAKYHLGQIVCHKKHPFRGVIFDVDPEFANTEEWYASIPEEARPIKDQFMLGSDLMMAPVCIAFGAVWIPQQ